MPSFSIASAKARMPRPEVFSERKSSSMMTMGKRNFMRDSWAFKRRLADAPDRLSDGQRAGPKLQKPNCRRYAGKPGRKWQKPRRKPREFTSAFNNLKMPGLAAGRCKPQSMRLNGSRASLRRKVQICKLQMQPCHDAKTDSGHRHAVHRHLQPFFARQQRNRGQRQLRQVLLVGLGLIVIPLVRSFRLLDRGIVLEHRCVVLRGAAHVAEESADGRENRGGHGVAVGKTVAVPLCGVFELMVVRAVHMKAAF